MAAVTICSDFGAQENNVCHCFPIYLPWSDGTGCRFECWVLSQLFHSLLSPSSRGSLVSLCFLPLELSSAYLRLLIFLPAILIPACASSSPAFFMMYSAYELNKQGDNIQPWPTSFPIWNQSVVPLSSSNCCFLTCVRVSQEAGKVICCSHFLKNFPECVVIHTVKGFSIVNDAEVYIFLWSNGCWQSDIWFLCLF